MYGHARTGFKTYRSDRIHHATEALLGILLIECVADSFKFVLIYL